MTSSRPERLIPPSLEAYPFIDVMFKNMLLGIAHAPFNVSNRCYLDNVYSQNYFPLENISAEQMAPLQAMNEATLDRLLYVLKPKIWNEIIDTKAALDQVALQAYDSHVDSNGGRIDVASLEQMVSYQVYKAVLTEPVHWGQMVDLYNNSAPDQQEAIHQFFLKNYNRQLDVILETPAHDLKLPESLNLTFETKIENGETFLYSEVEQQWMNEAKLQQLYRVVINFRGSANPDLLIATAPTAVQAIAFATLYAQNSTGKRPGDRITIRTDNGDIANADLKAISGGTQIQPLCDENVKLVWDLPKVGVSTGHYKAVRDNLVSLIENCNPKLRDGLEQEHREMCRLIHACASDTPESFTKAVLSAERALGVQWIKAQLLEDALGL